MQRPRDNFLAGAVRPSDQNIGIGRPNAFHEIEHVLHCW